MSYRAYLVAKGGSLDNITPDWFDKDVPIWCLNQSATVIHDLLPDREIHCVQNDAWLDYVPPSDVTWHCSGSVATGTHKHVEVYSPELLTGFWGSPSCVCALELMRCAGYDDITMIGFDSHFDNSRTYATCLGVKSDEIAPYHFYDTIMRRWAKRHNVTLHWVNQYGHIHDEDNEFSKCLVAVAIGDKYERQTDRMIESFLRHNPDWSVERFYDDDLRKLLPPQCQSWSSFNQCEIGRWIAMQHCLEHYDTVLYSDGDIRWYDKYESDFLHTIVLSPHYVTNFAKNNKKHFIQKDGAANIGIIEINRSIECNGLFDFVINEVLHNPPAFMHKDQLWLQNIVSTIPDCGYDAIYNNHAGYNVAFWNLKSGDREVYRQDGRYWVRTNTGLRYPLVSFHFSSKSLGMLVNYGSAVQRLLSEYANER